MDAPVVFQHRSTLPLSFLIHPHSSPSHPPSLSPPLCRLSCLLKKNKKKFVPKHRLHCVKFPAEDVWHECRACKLGFTRYFCSVAQGTSSLLNSHWHLNCCYESKDHNQSSEGSINTAFRKLRIVNILYSYLVCFSLNISIKKSVCVCWV